MNIELSLESVCAIKVALCVARLQHPGDTRFVEAYRETVTSWARELHDELPALLMKQGG